MFLTRCACIFFIITSTLSDHSKKFHLSYQHYGGSENFYKILKTYRQFYTNVHMDNITKNIANTFFSRHSSQLTIYNYDTLDTEQLVRPAAVRCLHLVVLTNPLRFAHYLTNHNNIFSSDVIMFLTMPPTLSVLRTKYTILPNLSKSGRIVFVNFNPRIEIYTMCFYCGHASEKFVLQAEPLVDTDNLLPQSFENFNGQLLKVGYVDYFPYLYCLEKDIQGGQIICNDAVGSEFELLKTLSEKMNFTFTLMQGLNSSYVKILDSLLHGKYDLAIGGISLTNSRRHVLQFSTVLRFEDVAFMFDYKRPMYMKTFLLGRTFNAKVGTSVLIAMSLLILLVHYVLKYFNDKSSFAKVVEVIGRIVLEQPIKLKTFIPDRTKISILVLLTSYWIFTLIMNTVYKSLLTAFSVRISPPETTLDELIKEGYRIVIDRSLENFLTEEEKEFIVKNPIIKKHNNLCDLAGYIENHKAIIPGEFARHMYHIELHCRIYLPKPLHHFTTKFFTVSPHAWPFKTGVPFVDSFDIQIRQITNGGLLKIWKEQALLENLHHYKIFFKKPRPHIQSETFYMQFAIYLIVMSICVVCFCLEIVCYHCNIRF